MTGAKFKAKSKLKPGPGSGAAKVVPLKPTKCPICARPSELAYRPFCSNRCADVDLGRWLGEEYRIPVEQGAEDGFELDDDEFPDT